MPLSALHPCSYPGCPELVRHGRCATHAGMDARQWHDPRVARLYKTTRWQRLRALQLAREPWCDECLKENIYVPATDVDHIIAHHGDPVAFYSNPLQSLCHACHSRKTMKELKHERL